MLRILSAVAVLGLIAGPALGQDEKVYTIRLKKPVEGQCERVDRKDKSAEHVKMMDNSGNVLQRKDQQSGHHFIYRQTILEMAPGVKRPARLKREYKKATFASGVDNVPLPFAGKTVLIEKKGGRYTFRIEGGKELTGDDAQELDKEFNHTGAVNESKLEKRLLPTRPVKLNETWNVDPKVFARLFQAEGLELDLGKTKASGKLTRVYEKDGHQFGVLELHVRVVPRAVHKGKMVRRFQPNSHVQIDITTDGCIDGGVSTSQTTYSGTAELESLGPDPDRPRFRMTIATNGKGVQKVVE